MKSYVFTTLVAFLFSLAFCFVLIPVLRKCKAGQNILHYVKEHEKKSGTPTMGGIAFLSAAVLTTLLFAGKFNKTLIVVLAVGLAYMAVGLMDDFLKKRHGENLGLKAYQKLIFQTLIAVFCGIYAYKAGLTKWEIPFFKASINLGYWIIPACIFVFLATVNAVNLTDGLDGLASGVSIPFFAFFGSMIALRGGNEGLSSLSFALVGSLLAYLLFNAPPASVFMGDTGSLSLGGFASAIALFSGNAPYIAVVGACFVFSVISVVMQVIYYKATKGKRIFLMAPVHHHFQKKGYAESKISYAYFVVTLLLGLLCLS